jgi:hypothetical protein
LENDLTPGPSPAEQRSSFDEEMPHPNPLHMEREQHTKPDEVIFTVELLVL